MPQRSNEFQELVSRLNRHLQSNDVLVEDSAMLLCRASGVKREIDILITDKRGSHTLTIGIEPTDTKAPVDVTYVEKKHTCHVNCGVSKTVIVSSKGFTQAARNYAKHNYIDLLTLAEAADLHWSQLVDQLQGARLVVEIIKIEKLGASLVGSRNSEGLDGDTIVETGLRQTDCVMNLVKSLAGSEGRQQIDLSSLEIGKNQEIVNRHENMWECQPPLRVVEDSDPVREIVLLKANYLIIWREIPFSLRHAQYGDDCVAYSDTLQVKDCAQINISASPSEDSGKAVVTLHIEDV